MNETVQVKLKYDEISLITFFTVSVTVIYIPLMLFGLLGNILTILVVWLRPHMRSSTYLYLSSMAVSDLLILLLLPLDLYKLWRPRPWPLGDLACKLTMFLSECCTFCTILHITFLSLERYLAVCWPITAKTMVTRHRTRVVIGCLWLGAAVSAAPVLVMVGVEDVGVEDPGLSQWREGGGWTGEFVIGGGETEGAHMALLDAGLDGIQLGEKETRGWDEELREVNNKSGAVTERKREDETKDLEEWNIDSVREQQNKKEDEGGGEQRADGGEGEIDRRECRCTHYAISSGLLAAMMILSNLYFLVPLCILGLVYSLIGRTLWLRPKSSRRDQSHRNTVKMLGMIVLAFVLCWLPFHVGRTVLSLSLDAHAYFLYYLSQYLNLVSSVLFYLSAAVNPLLYNLMSARYRLAVHSLVHKHSHTHSHRLRTLTSRHSTTTL
nr:growth hormone secretagogue receptor type 1 [Nothobranchius furzeri]